MSADEIIRGRTLWFGLSKATIANVNVLLEMRYIIDGFRRCKMLCADNVNNIISNIFVF